MIHWLCWKWMQTWTCYDHKLIYIKSYLVWPPPLWIYSMSLLRLLKRSLVCTPPTPCGMHCHPSLAFNQLVFQFGNCGGWEGIRSCTHQPKLSKGWSIGDCSGPGRQSMGMTWPTFKQFLDILQVCRHCLAGRENCFQQSDRLAGHVGEGLRPHSVCL